MKRSLAALALSLLLPALAAAEDFRMGDYRAPTPANVEGAVTVDTATAQSLLAEGKAVAIDVMAVPRQPGTGAWLLSKPRANLPGSVWLANVGHGALEPELERWFRDRLAQIQAERPGAGLLFYCLSDCWMSWNAAKRAAAWGFAPVYWYRDGTDGWAQAGLPLVPGHPEGPALDQGRMESSR